MKLLNSRRFVARNVGAMIIDALITRATVPIESLRAAGPGLSSLLGSKRDSAKRRAARLLPIVDPNSYKKYQAQQADRLLAEFRRTAPLKRHSLMAPLGKLGDKRAIVPIIQAIDTYRSEMVRPESTDSIHRQREALARRKMPYWINAGIEALGHIGGPKAIAAIRGYLTVDDKAMRLACIRALGLAGDQTAVAEFRPLLKNDESQPETLAAAEALAHLGDMQSLKRIMEIANTSGPKGRALRRDFTGFFGPARSDADRSAREKWRRQTPVGLSPDTRLEKTLESLSRRNGGNIVVNWRELGPLGIKARKNVQLRTGEGSSAFVLIGIMGKAGDLDRIGFRLVEGALYVTSARHVAHLPSLKQLSRQAVSNSARIALKKSVMISARAKPFSEVIERLASESGLKIALAETASTQAGIDPDTEIDLAPLNKLPLIDALLLAWIQVGAGADMAMTEQNGTLMLVPQSLASAAGTTGGAATRPAGPKVSVKARPSADKAQMARRLRLANTYRKTGLKDRARKKYLEIIKDYPGTKTAEIARQRLESMGK